MADRQINAYSETALYSLQQEIVHTTYTKGHLNVMERLLKKIHALRQAFICLLKNCAQVTNSRQKIIEPLFLGRGERVTFIEGNMHTRWVNVTPMFDKYEQNKP